MNLPQNIAHIFWHFWSCTSFSFYFIIVHGKEACWNKYGSCMSQTGAKWLEMKYPEKFTVVRGKSK